MAPKVSVITPIYNVEEFLTQCLKSLSRQTLGDIEFICVNDGSTDSSLQILRSFANRDERFVVIDKPNGGYGHAMNKGLEAARGEYIGIVESDDFVEPDAFESLYLLARDHGFCDIVKGNHYVYGTGFYPTVVENYPPELCGRVLSPLDDDGARVINSIPAIWAAIYRREFLEDNGIRFRETPGAAFQDTGFVYKAWIAANSFFLTHDAYLFYRIDNDNSSVKSPEKALYACNEFESIERFLERRPDRLAALKPRVTAKKFNTYLWNYDRIDIRFRRDFLDLTSAELELANQRGELDERFYDPDEWSRLIAIADDPQAVFDLDVSSSKAPSDTAVSQLRALPSHLRKRFEPLANDLHRKVLACRKERFPGAAAKTVSVVIPVFNAEPFLDELFDSLLAQTHENLQIICVENGSSDASLSKLSSYASVDTRITVVTCNESGAGAARNKGIDLASGDYLCFVDADDYLEGDAIARVVDAAEEHKADVVIFGIDEYQDDTHRHVVMDYAVAEGKIPDNRVFRPMDIDNFFVNMTGFTVNKLYRMEFFRKFDFRFPNIGAHEDMPFTYAAVISAERAYYLDRTLYHYRLQRSDSRSASTEKAFEYALDALLLTRSELKRLGIWESCERDFVNYALSVCRWKFWSLEGMARRRFHAALCEGGWFDRLGIAGRNSSYFFEDIDREFYLQMTTEDYTQMLEDQCRWFEDDLSGIRKSRAFRLGNAAATPLHLLKKLLAQSRKDESRTGS